VWAVTATPTIGRTNDATLVSNLGDIVQHNGRQSDAGSHE